MHDMEKIAFRASGVSIVLIILLFLYGRPLPELSRIVPDAISTPPLQANIKDAPSFESKLGDISYLFLPHATYTLTGLVVSLHHSDSWIDISHAFDPAQTADLCIVWGENLANGMYRKASFSNGDWSCSWKLPNREAYGKFDMSLISNNHVIPATRAIARLVDSVKVGDQIVVEGILTEYARYDADGNLVGKRGTSLTRADTGNGACETILVSDIRFLRRHMPWREPLMMILTLIVFGGPIGVLIAKSRRKRPLIVEREVYHAPDPRNIADPRNHMYK